MGIRGSKLHTPIWHTYMDDHPTGWDSWDPNMDLQHDGCQVGDDGRILNPTSFPPYAQTVSNSLSRINNARE